MNYYQICIIIIIDVLLLMAVSGEGVRNAMMLIALRLFFMTSTVTDPLDSDTLYISKENCSIMAVKWHKGIVIKYKLNNES